uniref:Uncharacterized protein n=1 Tax=Branchiostoma floridae TaxID=7739 RepID=C3ZD02_BRAFL|eukprot:XP_002593502.1 hypothetical protein BRAFLDRAFT_101849 [Branchiostoma floridae]
MDATSTPMDARVQECTTYALDARVHNVQLTPMSGGQDTKPVIYSERLSEKSSGTDGKSIAVYTAGSATSAPVCYGTTSASIGEGEGSIYTSAEEAVIKDFQANNSATSENDGSDNDMRTDDVMDLSLGASVNMAARGGSTELWQLNTDLEDDGGTKSNSTAYQDEPGDSRRDDVDMKPYAIAYMCETDIEVNTDLADDDCTIPYATRYEDTPNDAGRHDVNDPPFVANMSEAAEVPWNQLRPNPMYAPNDGRHARAVGFVRGDWDRIETRFQSFPTTAKGTFVLPQS